MKSFDAAKALGRALEIIDELLDYVDESVCPGTVQTAEEFLDAHTNTEDE